MSEIMVKGPNPIVAVDDDDCFRELLEFVYKNSGLDNEFVQMPSGPECLNYLEKCIDDGTPLPSVILMDINMPEMTGFETVESIRHKEILKSVPVIIMLSSSDEEDDIKRAFQSGANDYLEKPYGISMLKFVGAPA